MRQQYTILEVVKLETSNNWPIRPTNKSQTSNENKRRNMIYFTKPRYAEETQSNKIDVTKGLPMALLSR